MVSLAVPALSVPVASPGTGDVSGIVLGAKSGGERGPVSFPHDKHTLNVKDCGVCHQAFTAEGATPFAFAPNGIPQKKVSRENFMHKGCVTCHEMQERGPLQAQCVDCHKTTSAPVLFKPGMDRSLHARHIASPFVADDACGESPVRGQNCAVCHHPVAQNAVSAEGSDPSVTASEAMPVRESCRTCHADGGTASTTQPSFRTISHETCVLCHQDMLQSGKVSGPVQCAGCHDAAVFAGYQRLNPVPLLQAGQPVAVTLQSVETPSMPGVPFNHRLHENSLPSCSSCHHNTVQACSTCHTPNGDPKGGNVSLSAAMHDAQSQNSCVGCHEQRQLSQPECAGCHAMRPAGSVAENCGFCHRPALPVAMPEPPVCAPEAAPSVSSSTPSASTSAPVQKSGYSVAVLISPESESVIVSPEFAPATPPAASVQTVPGTSSTETVVAPVTPPMQVSPVASGEPASLPAFPETVTIGGLSNEFQPSQFPHGNIVRALQRGISSAEPSLTLRHNDTAVCAACHHNSPVTATPPACGSCHLPVAGPAQPNTPPALRLAYHQQCMGCHERMNIATPANTDCAGCHAPVVK